MSQASEMKENNEKYKTMILRPAYHALSTPKGKSDMDVEKLISAYNVWLKIPEKEVKILKEAFNLLKSSYLIERDLPNELTSAEESRHKTHEVFGIALTLNAITYAESLAFNEIFKMTKTEGFRTIVEHLIESQKAWSTFLHWNDSLLCPSEEEYLEICSCMRKQIFLAAFDIMKMLSGATDMNFERIAGLLGQIFQLRQDYTDLCSKNGVWRTNCVAEGRFVFPVVHAVRNGLEKGQIASAIRQRIKAETTRAYVVQLLRDVGSMEYTKRKISELRCEIEEELEKFEENPIFLEIVRDYCTVDF